MNIRAKALLLFSFMSCFLSMQAENGMRIFQDADDDAVYYLVCKMEEREFVFSGQKGYIYAIYALYHDDFEALKAAVGLPGGDALPGTFLFTYALKTGKNNVAHGCIEHAWISLDFIILMLEEPEEIKDPEMRSYLETYISTYQNDLATVQDSCVAQLAASVVTYEFNDLLECRYPYDLETGLPLA